MTKNAPSPDKRPRRITAEMVARAAGVSRSAVSRAFTDGTYLDAEKRKKIREVAAEMGYHPNAMAAGLQGGRSDLIAIFLGNMRSHYDTEFVNMLVSKLNALRKWPILIDGGDDQAKTAVEDVLRLPLEGLIVRGGSMPAALVDHCAKLGIPMISSGRPVDAPGIDNVCCRNALGATLVTQELLARGRRRFGFIRGPSDFFCSGERHQGMLKALRDAGLTPVAEAEGDFTVETGYAVAQSMLQEATLDALVCANDSTAIGALIAARESGVDVPGDLSIVGFDDIQMSSWPMFNLSTVCNPIEGSVDAVIDLLDRRLGTPGKPPETVNIDPYFVPRGTH